MPNPNEKPNDPIEKANITAQKDDQSAYDEHVKHLMTVFGHLLWYDHSQPRTMYGGFTSKQMLKSLKTILGLSDEEYIHLNKIILDDK